GKSDCSRRVPSDDRPRQRRRVYRAPTAHRYLRDNCRNSEGRDCISPRTCYRLKSFYPLLSASIETYIRERLCHYRRTSIRSPPIYARGPPNSVRESSNHIRPCIALKMHHLRASDNFSASLFPPKPSRSWV